MPNLLYLLKQGDRFLRHNSPTLLTALGVSGTVYTAYLTGKATWIAVETIEIEEEDHLLSNKERFALVWDLYIPPVLAGALTVGCIVGANRVSSKRIAAAYSLVALSERTFEEYRDKVVEQIGNNKEQAVRDEIAQDKVTNAPQSKMIMIESGEVLCFESMTGRYFTSSMERLKRSENEINAYLLRESYATLDDFYYMVGLDSTDDSCRVGWVSERMLELGFSSTISKSNTPCLVVTYNYIRPI